MLARLIDGSAYLHRAFHAMPPLSRPSDNHPVGAVNGFCRVLLSISSGTYKRRPPARFTAVIFDKTRANWRNDVYPDYKAQRAPTPDDLRAQMPLMREATHAFGLPCVELARYEADDILATYARIFAESGTDVEIVTGDKDLTQLIRTDPSGARVGVYDPFWKDPETKFAVGKELTVQDVKDKFGGCGPELVADCLALMGDQTDNVPGVPSVGVKTAAALLLEHGSLEAVLDAAPGITKPKLRQALIEHANLARVSREIVALADNIPSTMIPSPAELEYYGPDWREVRGFFEQMEFKALLEDMRVAA